LKESALPYLRKLLPVYSNPDSLTATFTGPTYRSLFGVGSDIPLSPAEIEESWIQICAFSKDGICFRPTAGSLLEVWKAIMSAAVAEDIPLASSFLVDDLWKASKDSEFPRALFDAILARVANKGSMEVESNYKCAQVKTF
jgi:sister chromatid cohesion protein DCC1